MKIVILDGYTTNSETRVKALEKYGELVVYDRTSADRLLKDVWTVRLC